MAGFDDGTSVGGRIETFDDGLMFGDPDDLTHFGVRGVGLRDSEAKAGCGRWKSGSTESTIGGYDFRGEGTRRGGSY